MISPDCCGCTLPAQTQITGTVAVHPDDLMTTKRQAILQPLTAEISRGLKRGLGLNDPGSIGERDNDDPYQHRSWGTIIGARVREAQGVHAATSQPAVACLELRVWTDTGRRGSDADDDHW
jgi:hypothetical protein